MILVETGQDSDPAFEARLLFAGQLRQRGHDAVLDGRTFPAGATRTARYEAAPLLATVDPDRLERVILLGTGKIDAGRLAAFRDLSTRDGLRVDAVDRFSSRQDRIGVANRLSYALMRDVNVVDLARLQPSVALSLGPALPVAAGPRAARRDGPVRLLLILTERVLDEPGTLPFLSALAYEPDVVLTLAVTAKGKAALKASRHHHLRVLSLGELPPHVVAGDTDVAAVFGDGLPGARMSVVLLEILRAGGVVIDGTEAGTLRAAGMPALAGPAVPEALAGYLRRDVLPNRAAIAADAGAARWLAETGIETLERALDLPAPAPRPDRPGGATVFLPTNGVGLGHARRCLLAAEALTEGGPVGFAAFPSCLPMIRRRGFATLPLASRSDAHPDAFANDLLNFARLSRALSPGDRLIFDGNYVHESVYRAVAEKRLAAMWIRRGLWRPGHRAGRDVERHGVFRRVILPLEAFDELNAPAARDGAHAAVGPVVDAAPPDPDAAQAMRARLAATYGAFDRLVVTMLGAGVAADRTAQTQFLAALIEDRADTLHVVVAWPGAPVAAELLGWRRTAVVRTTAASELLRAADLLVAAAGYNTFHEALYNRVPAIFVPQVAAYMDMQEKRAEAAEARGLARAVAPGDFVLLERAVTRALDGGADELRAALRDVALPAPGTAALAAEIARLGRCP